MKSTIKNKEINYNKIIIHSIVILAWMAFIFHLSNQPATISANQSGGFITMIVNTPIIGTILKPILKSSIGEFLIRKSAHMFLYFVLAILVFSLLYRYKYHNNSKKMLKAMAITLLIVFLYACTDEIHQLYIPGRSGEFRDVMVDTMGGLIGLILIRISKVSVGKLKIKN